MLRLLQQSSESKKPLEIIYMADNGSITQRSIIVYEINETKVKAWCLLRHEKRVAGGRDYR